MKSTLLSAFLLFLGAFCCPAADKVALIVGNSAYKNGSVLRNPVNDAKAVGEALKAAGFSVTVVTDAGLEKLEKAITVFGREAKMSKVAWFYYAGHGMEVKGTNYLVPVDAQVEEEAQIKYRTVSLNLAMDTLDESGAGLKVITLDCCRNNPLGRGFHRSSGGNGLAALTATPQGTIIAYATAPGNTAADGSGENSPYTTAFLKELKTPGLQVEEIFKRTAKGVLQATEKAQQPWMSSSFVDSFILLPVVRPPLETTTSESTSRANANGASQDVFTKPEFCKFDLKGGTIGGVSPLESPREIKRRLPFFSGETDEGRHHNYGGGVFYLPQDFYFYTGQDVLEIRKPCTISGTEEWLGADSETLRKKLGEPVQKITYKGGSQMFFYKQSYGAAAFDVGEKGRVETIRIFNLSAPKSEALAKSKLSLGKKDGLKWISPHALDKPSFSPDCPGNLISGSIEKCPYTGNYFLVP